MSEKDKPLTARFVEMIFACVVVAVLVVVFAFSTFATQKYVDDKFQLLYDELHDTRDKVYELNGEKAPSKVGANGSQAHSQ